MLNRREFMAGTGAGLLITVFAPPVEAETIGARIHIGDDGIFTVMTGKVEEGQGARTEVAIAAAEELGVPLGRVRVLTADTDITPNDGITAGSRTTPSTVPLVRRAAASAREVLARASADKNLSEAELARTLPADVKLTSPKDWKTAGRSHHRLNARDIVTGAHRFPSDVAHPGMLYGAVLRPPAVGATLDKLDLTEARTLPGVIVAGDGEFAACAAPSRYAARKAVAKLAAAATWKTKDQPSSSQLFEYLKQHAEGEGRAQTRGLLEQALGGAAHKLNAAYRVAYVQHAPMEPRAATAEWNDGKLTVWAGTDNPFGVRDELARAFQLDPRKVRVIVPDVGGGFGGKHTGEAALEAARLAKASGKPVNVQWTRAEEFMWAYARPAALIEIEAGLDGKGGVIAWDFANYNSGTAGLDTPYRIANVRTRYVPCNSPLRQGSYRCLAATANNFARESFMDELAALAKADPFEFRLAHLENPRMRDVLSAAADRFNWRERRAKKRRPNTGIGLACGTEKGSVVAACVEVEVDRATGVPRLVEIVEAFECGPIFNPGNVKAQVEGCIIMGLGAAVREELQFDNGRLTNGTFAKYRPPRFRDMPRIDVVLLDKSDSESAGAGETPIIAVAPAMANAVFDAAGERVRQMPIRLRKT